MSSLSSQLKKKIKGGKTNWTLRMMAAGCDTGGNRPACLEASGRGGEGRGGEVSD